MTNTPLIPLVLITLILSLYLPVSYAGSAKQEVVTIDGREILLNEDSTWTYRSSDRYVSTDSGRLVRLKEDGSWEYVGNTPVKSRQQVRTRDLDIKLQKVVIEKHEKKVQKNSRVKTQTVFYVNLEYSPQAKTAISITDSDISYIEVKDNNGKSYPVVSLQADRSQLLPDSETTLVIRAKKSPSILNDVKSMDLIFNTGIFGIESPIILNQSVYNFFEDDVDGFE